MRLTIVTAALVASSLSFAFSPVFAAGSHEGHGKGDRGGRTDTFTMDLGVDISMAGNTPAQVQKFLGSLPPNTRELVLDGCRHYLSEPAQAQEATIVFCKLAI